MKNFTKLFLRLCLVVLILAVTQTAISSENQTTTTPTKGRYEIIQSPLNEEHTYRLDRFTGNVYRFGKTKNNANTWKKMIVQGLPEVQYANTPRFIIFISASAAGYLFLMDTQTGQTWFVTKAKVPGSIGGVSEVMMWKKFKE